MTQDKISEAGLSERPEGLVVLKVRDNEAGSVSVSALDGGHVILKVVKQSRMGLIESSWEVSLAPNELLHVSSMNRPTPEVSDA